MIKNVLTHLQDLSVEEIKDHCQKTSVSASVAMVNIEGDFNFSTMVRNANFFGFREVHHVGNSKKWDKRGSVGTHHYTPITFHKSEVEFIDSVKKRFLVAIENNIPEYAHKTEPIKYMRPYHDVVFIFGSENTGLSAAILDKCDIILTIPSYGSVRSLNVGTVSGIIMSQYRIALENYYSVNQSK